MVTEFYTENIGYEPKIDFENFKVEIKNGSPELLQDAEAIKQWITKFCITVQDSYEIYSNTGYGTRIKDLFGHKRVGYGFEESELQRDFEEGLILCPAISRVSNFEVAREGRTLKIELQVELYNGELLDVDISERVQIKF